MTEATTQDLMDAARAAGYEPVQSLVLTEDKDGAFFQPIIMANHGRWSPLTNADQREMLAEKCGMEIDFNNKGPKGSIRLSTGHKVLWPSDAPSFPHAIVRAAAMHWRARK